MNITEQSFLNDVKDHELTVIRNDGLYRQLRFTRPGSVCYGFDLVTWPGYLAYTGDMGCYVFSRSADMFEFFRTNCECGNQKVRTLYINQNYWAEKIQAQDKYDGITEFDEDNFNRVVIGILVRWIREHRCRTTKDQRRGLWGDFIKSVINVEAGKNGDGKKAAAFDFNYRVNDDLRDFEFTDLFDYSFCKYTTRFTWCCYAIAWGIQKYDEATA